MPLLWRDNAVGWTNVGLRDGHLSVESGFVEKRPLEPAFRREFEREVESLKAFLGLESGG